MTGRPAHIYPFTAIVGQETLKTALLLNAIDPLVGGVLIRGEKGTAKSTAVRGLATVLPEMDAIEDCRFSCDPSDPGSWCIECRERRESGPLPKTKTRPLVVDLPVSATEDRLVGTLDLEHALKTGERKFEAGLLAQANRSILYVDEVNLLDDHLVDTLLDAAAMGVNTVQREGIAFSHPSRFMIVGTMNPEEGDVRPQLLDRFGLCVEVAGVRDTAERVDIVRRRRAFEEDPSAFTREWIDAEDELTVNLKHSRLRLPSIELSDEILHSIAALCAELGVDGHRADIVMARAACAYAALENRQEVLAQDVRFVAPLVLAHRVKKTPFQDQHVSEEKMRDSLAQAFGDSDPEESPGDSVDGADPADGDSAPAGFGMAETGLVEDALTPELEVEIALDSARRSVSGRRQESISSDSRGRYTRARKATQGETVDVALDASIRASAPMQMLRDGDMAVNLTTDDLMTKVRKRKVGASIVFCVDGSGSMGADSRMESAKSAIMELLVDAYQRRDRVGLVSFRGDDADVVLAPTASVELAQIKLRNLPTGGATPLAHGVIKSLEILDTELKRNDETIPWLILVTDGRANVGLDGGLGSEDARAVATRLRTESINTLVVDTSATMSSGSGAREIARAAGAEYVRLRSLTGEDVANTVRSHVHG